ncbi:hypothetical protein AB0L79_32955, partial [Streptomyces tendae]
TFGLGAAVASLVWFAALGFGARYLGRFLARPLKPRVTLRPTPHWRPPGTPATAGRPPVATPPPADRSPSAEVPGAGGTAPDRTVPLATEPAVSHRPPPSGADGQDAGVRPAEGPVTEESDS